MLVVKCDVCKQAIEEDMDILEIRQGTAGAGPTDVTTAHVCKACQEKLGIGEYLHKLRSAGFRSQNVRKDVRSEIAQPDGTPIPVDPRFIKRIQGRS